MITREALLDEARKWIGYREKDHASADLYDLTADAGTGNYTIFSVLCGYGIQPWQWCQMYVCGVMRRVAGSIDEAKRMLCDTENNGVLASYTPTGAGFFKKAGRWFTVPEPGDVVYFYGYVSSEGRYRICHTGYVESVNEAEKTFITIEGNTNSDGFSTNGGCVARHEYSYAEVGGMNRVNGFGRPLYIDDTEDDETTKVRVRNMATYKLEQVSYGSVCRSVVILKSILHGTIDGTNGQPFYRNEPPFDDTFVDDTEKAVRKFQTVGNSLGWGLEVDGICGPATWGALLSLQKV